jgi:hypothetical protein
MLGGGGCSGGSVSVVIAVAVCRVGKNNLE